VHRKASEQRFDRSPTLWMVVITRQEDNRDPMLLEAGQRLVDHLLGVWRRCEVLEDVAAGEHRIDFMLSRCRDNQLECVTFFVESRAARERLADMPVASVKEPHRPNLSNRSPAPGGASASLTRVANALGGGLSAGAIGGTEEVFEVVDERSVYQVGAFSR
jgi:hypothetical protein